MGDGRDEFNFAIKPTLDLQGSIDRSSRRAKRRTTWKPKREKKDSERLESTRGDPEWTRRSQVETIDLIIFIYFPSTTPPFHSGLPIPCGVGRLQRKTQTDLAGMTGRT